MFPQNLTEHINERNRSAQIAQRESQLLFQTLYFKGKSPEDPRCIVEAVIFSIRANGFLVNTFQSNCVNVKFKFKYKNYLNFKLQALYIFSVFRQNTKRKEILLHYMKAFLFEAGYWKKQRDTLIFGRKAFYASKYKSIIVCHR